MCLISWGGESLSLRVGILYKPFLRSDKLDKIQGYQMQNHKPQNMKDKTMQQYSKTFNKKPLPYTEVASFMTLKYF